MKTFVDELVEKGERKGMRKGERKGEKRKALKIAETMKAEGMDIDTISRLTGLTVDDVLRL